MTGFYKIRNLRKHYSPGDAEQLPAIEIKNLDIELGGIIAIVGGSGSGKTTLLNLLSGLEPGDQSSRSTPLLELQLPHTPTIYKLARKLKFSRKIDSFPHHSVSYVFQQGYLLNHASIGLNLAMTRRAAGLPVDSESLESLLELAQLNDASDPTMQKKRLSDRAITLSGGQKQRINIARALGRNPRLIYADELSSSLDPNTAREVMSKLRGWIWTTEEDQLIEPLVEPVANGSEDRAIKNRTSLGRSMLWVTHDYALASEFADAVIVLTEGRLAKNCDSPVELEKSRSFSQIQTLEAGILEWVQTGEVPDRSNGGKDHSVLYGLGPVESDKLQLTEPFIEANSKSKALLQASGTENIIGNLGSGIALSWMEAFRQPAVSKWSALNWLTGLFRPVFGFTHWVRAIQLSAILALIAIIVYGQKEVIQYFDQQLRDPSLRHVIVNQSLREITRSRIDDVSLIELSKKINSFDVINDADENVAFGRHTEYVDAFPGGFVGNINAGYVPEITIGIIDAGEPVYSLAPVFKLDESRPGCDRERTALPAELIKSPTEQMLIVSTDYIEAVRKMYGVDLCMEPFLQLHDRGEPRTFQIVGFVDKGPADGFTYFDALMQVNTWKTWLSLVGKSPRPFYERASVYFTQQNHSAVIDELRNRSFAFDREIISKFERLMSTSAQLRNTFLVITWLTLVVAITVAAGLIWSYLAQNAKSIAVLRAHDAWFWPLLAAIPFQLLLTFIYALFYLAIVTLIWNQIVDLPAVQYFGSQISSGAWKPSVISYAMIQPALPWIAASLIAMFVVGIICLLIWRITHRKLAHELRQAY